VKDEQGLKYAECYGLLFVIYIYIYKQNQTLNFPVVGNTTNMGTTESQLAI